MTNYLTAADIKSVFAEVDADDNLRTYDVDRLISERLGHTSTTCLGVAHDCAVENRRDAGQDDDLYETYADAAGYLVDGLVSCYCEPIAVEAEVVEVEADAKVVEKPRFFVDAMHKDVPGVGQMVDYWRVVDRTTGMRADGTARYETPERAQQWCDSLNATA